MLVVVVGHWEAVREVARRPPPIGGHCMVRFDSHRAVMYGGTSGREISDCLYVVDLGRRVSVAVARRIRVYTVSGI